MLPVVRVDLEALKANYRFLCDKAPSAQVGAAVKANAYGLGMIPVAKALYAEGCRLFFTAYFEEALALRAVLTERDAAIAVLHAIEESAHIEALEKSITPVLNHVGEIKAWQATSHHHNRLAPVMIHLDTGMNRLGLSPQEQQELCRHHEWLDGLDVCAWVSHFARADEFGNAMTVQQRGCLLEVLDKLPKAPISLCNSSGLFWGADYHFDIARPGIALYGGNPTPHLSNPMQGVIELQAPILQIRNVEEGMTVGYGAKHSIKSKGKIATVGLGYADGYHRSLSGQGTAMIGAFEVPVVGRISMDLITLDVSHIPDPLIRVGQMATLIGPHRPIDVVAQEAGTISYEILTSLGSRIQRDYSDKSGL